MKAVNQYERAYRAWQILVRVAQSKQRITYGQLAAELKIYHRADRFVLDKIQDYCLKEKLPPLTILVENKIGVIGSGFIAWKTDDLDAGLQKVHGFNWDQIQNPFIFASGGETPEEIASALTKRTVTAQDIYARVRVRGMGQVIFRETLLQVYAGCCAFSGFKGAVLLEAAHILRWVDCAPEQRLDPSNGILLSVLHHRLFDEDWIRIDQNYHIFINRSLVAKQSLSKDESTLLERLHGKAMVLPTDRRNWPSKQLLAERYESRQK